MRYLFTLLILSFVVLSSGCNSDGYSCNSEGCYIDKNPQYQTLNDCLSDCYEDSALTSECGDMIDHHDYTYNTVQIGNQCWFAENLRYLPSVSSYWTGNNNEPVYYVYDYTGYIVDDAKATAAYNTYGVLYNWPAVMNDDICPSGWHMPSDVEWQILEMSLGMSSSQASSLGWRGTDQGHKMKSNFGWNGSNSSGFNGLPAGFRTSNGFKKDGENGVWWGIPTGESEFSWIRSLYNYYDNVQREYYVQPSGYALSARCVKD